jgi:hypothetical protein
LFRVRANRTGQPEQDIGFLSNGFVDTAALQSFVGSSSAFVTTVYRQDGSTSHLTQTTAAEQPRVALNGTLDDGMLFVTNMRMQIASAAASTYTDGTNTQILLDVKPNSDGRMIDFGPDALSTWFPLSGQVYLDLPFPSGRVNVATPSGLVGSLHICSIEREGSTARLRTDGSVSFSGSVTGTISGTSVLNVGSTIAGSGYWGGCIRSLIIWKNCSSPATRAGALTL